MVFFLLQQTEQAARLEQELNKLRIDKLVLEEQKAQAQKGLQEARRENEILKGRVDASESALAKVYQKHVTLQHTLEQSEKQSKELVRRGSLLTSEFADFSLAEMDELEEYCHRALKRLGIAKVRIHLCMFVF